MSHILTDLREFLNASATSWHAVKEIGNRLATCDFIPLYEEEKWHLEPGHKYFLARGGALCAFSIPKSPLKKAIILAAHTDSPALKLKPNAMYHTANMLQCGVEVYGSPLFSSWLNRDLVLAGRMIVTNSQGQPEEKLILLDDTVLFIPQLAIHLDRTVNEKGLLLNPQENLCPIIGLSDDSNDSADILEKLLRRHHSFHSLLSYELFLVPREKAHFVGLKHEMIASSRLDNLASVHAALTAFARIESSPQDTLQMTFFWDHEEIGSHTPEGAASAFFEDVLKRIGFCLKMNQEELLLLKNHSLCVSIDMAHAFNPNYPKKHEPQHQTLLNKGIAIKYNANHKYATNAMTAAVIIHACQQLNLPFQSYVMRSDMPCGSTVGPLMAQNTGISTVDIGCPQLSMHSIREVMATQDYLDLIRLLTHLMQEE